MVSQTADNFWVPYGNGYEMTQSQEIIAGRLLELKQRKSTLVLVHEQYQSGPSVLVGIEEGRLLIDKPRDWPGTENRVRVIFRDRNNIWNHFFSTVATTGSDTLYVTIPTRFFMLQRRESYRVDVPSGSLASFSHQKNHYAEILIKDLSAGGMQIASRRQIPLEQGAVLERIMLSLPLGSSPSPVSLPCRRGDVIRTSRDPQTKIFLYGVKFQATPREEEAIIRYVRQRELELLRKPADVTG